MMKSKFFSVLVLGILLIGACSDPKPELHTQDLVGEWNLDRAERDGKETATLVGLIFHFKRDEFIKLNLPHPQLSAENDYKYELKDGKIKLLNADLTFELISITPEQLVLKSILEGNEFTFWLSK